MGRTVGFVAGPFGLVTDLLTNRDVENAVRLDVVGMDELYVPARLDHFEWVFVIDRDSTVKDDEFGAAFGSAIIAAKGDEWRRQRDGLDPLLHWDRVDDYTSVMHR